MISPLQNLQALIGIEQQLLTSLLQNIGSGAEPMQQTVGQTGMAENSPQTPPLPCPSPSRGEGLRERVIIKGGEGGVMETIKETGDLQLITQKEQAPSLKEQIVSLSQTLVQQGHLPSSTLNQPIPVIIPQMLACLGKLHREEKKKAKKKKKKQDGESEDQRDTPIDALLKQIFRLEVLD